ncbi:YoaK family protein [Chitinophaga sp.]|uniref:YoaK family protein n=1 Tax=Chitinophaga sp. TaxID=1869181 RepID=UPI0031D25751
MFRHLGQKRSFKHNIRLAVLLCLTAGFVNASGFLGFSVLTTNITGHAALLAVKLTEGDLRAVRMVTLWLILFLSGAFCSSLYISKAGRDKPHSYTVPIMVEIVILCLVGYFGYTFDNSVVKTEYFAGSLLFAMGMQNALVSVVSGSVVRTTHLTGMFTDLGIDLAAALSKYPATLHKRIVLRCIIIIFFLLGGVIGGFAFVKFRFHSFYIAAGILIIAMFYDFFRVNFKLMVSKVRKNISSAE